MERANFRCVFDIEFHKSGLPHVHLLVIIDPKDKLRSTSDFDAVISAEVSSPDQSELRSMVLKWMIHRSYGDHNPNAASMVKDMKDPTIR